MLKAIKQQFQVSWKDWSWGIALILGAAVFGQILLAFIMYSEPTVTYIPVGTIMAAIAAVLYVGIMVITQIRVQFHIQVSMGCIRTRFFVTYFLLSFAAGVLSWLLVLAVGYIENILNPIWYPGLGNELDMMPYLIKWGIPAAALTTVIGGFCGVLIMRFGKVAGWILWGIWMFACVGFPQFHEATEEVPNSLFGQIGFGVMSVLTSVPGHVWFIILAVVSVFCFAASYVMLRKMEVKA